MRKSLLITYFFPPKIGGIENYLFNVCKRLPRDKIVVLADSDGSTRGRLALPEDKEGGSFKIYRIKFFSWKFFKPSWLPLAWKIRKIIKKEKIEILQFGHYAHYCLLGFLFRRLFGLPYLIYVHGVDLWVHQKGGLGRWLMKLNFKNADKIIANSYFMKKEILKLGTEEEKVVVIHPGVEVREISLIIREFNREAYLKLLFNSCHEQGRNAEKKVILSLGRLIRLKGYDLVIKALPEVIKKIPNLIYLIVGEGKAEKELRELTKKLNLKKYVIFVGAVKGSEETRAPYYNLADVFVGPSRKIQYKNYKHVESFGIAYLEAQACGKPVIATKIGGIPEAVLDGETGILISLDDPQALAQALIKILMNKELSEEMGRKGRERVAREFNWERQIKKTVKLLCSSY